MYKYVWVSLRSQQIELYFTMGLLAVSQIKEAETASEAQIFTPFCTDLGVYPNCT